jgi:hypothetical protein
MAGSKGGKPGQWSARKAQLVSQRYKKAGGGYTGSKSKGQKSLSKWTKEEWGTKSGKPSTQGKKATGERYLPKKARQALSSKEYAATSRKKRADTKKGKQFSRQPKRNFKVQIMATKDSRLKRAGVSGYNKPKRTPNHPKKSHVVVAKSGGKVKTIRFGQQGVSGAGKNPTSAKQKARRKSFKASFKARHGSNIAKGKMSAAYWADKVKW